MKYNNYYKLSYYKWFDRTYSIMIHFDNVNEPIPLSSLTVMQDLFGIPWYNMPDILYKFNAIDDDTHDWCFPDKESTELCIVTLNMLHYSKGE